MSKVLLATAIAVLSCAFASITAQEPAPKPPTSATPGAPPPAADPFIRKPNAKAAAAPAPALDAKPAPAPVNILTTLETWTLSQADFVTLLDGPANERAPYDALETLAKTGKARLTGLIAVVTKSGQRAVVEAIDEVRYPTEFNPAQRAGEIAFPTAWETRNVGETLEIEPQLGPDGTTIDVNLAPRNTRLIRFQDWKAEAVAEPASQPLFQSESVATSAGVQSGRPLLLSTATRVSEEPAQGPQQVSVRAVRSTVQVVSRPVEAVENPTDLRVELLVYSMSRDAAQRVLVSASDAVESFAAVRSLAAKGEAELETINVLLNKSGQRAVNQESLDFRYPATFVAPGYDSQTIPSENRQPAGVNAFETRNVGVAVEIELTIGPDDRLVDINVVPQIVRYAGLLQAPGGAAKYPPQPIFTTRKITTSALGGAGQPILLGTMSQPGDTGVNGRQDDGRTSLAYIRVTPIRP